jgi:hypothetical protein
MRLVAARLVEDALARIDQDHGEARGGGAGGHVAGELRMARRVGDDEAALLRGEEAVGHVDGDALLALGLKAVQQQREVDASPCVPYTFESASSARIWSSYTDFDSQQPTDQRGLPVVHAAARDELQRLLRRGHQK